MIVPCSIASLGTSDFGGARPSVGMCRSSGCNLDSDERLQGPLLQAWTPQHKAVPATVGCSPLPGPWLAVVRHNLHRRSPKNSLCLLCLWVGGRGVKDKEPHNPRVSSAETGLVLDLLVHFGGPTC